MTLIRATLIPPPIPLRHASLYLVTARDTCRGYVTSVLPKPCLSSRAATVEVYVRASPRCPSMALLSLCIKPLSPFALTPRQAHSIPARPLLHLSRFHPRRFIEPSTPSSAASGRSGCLARTRASRAFPSGCIAKSIPTQSARARARGRRPRGQREGERKGRVQGWRIRGRVGDGGQGGFREG